MLLPATPQFRRKRGGPKKASTGAPPGPTPLTLVSAIYDPGPPSLLLTFDRPIDASANIFEAFLLADVETYHQYLMPYDWSAPDAFSVEFILVPTEPASGLGVHLNAAEGNGIVALADGQPWPGCTNLLLPFP
jgi:hypothetical protein